MGESAEDLLPADPVLGEVDRFGWLGVSLGRCELAKSTVRPPHQNPGVYGQLSQTADRWVNLLAS